MALRLEKEQEIISRAQSGEEEAFEELILEYSTPLSRMVLPLARDTQEVEEIVQEAFWRAWKNLERYQNDRPFFPYLVSIALNYLRDRIRSEKWIDSGDIDDKADEIPDDSSLTELKFEHGEMVELLRKGVNTLSKPYQLVVRLRYQGDMSYEEIAAVLKIPVNTVRTHLRRAKAQIRTFLENNS